MTRRFNPPPGWPAPPEEWLPPPGWLPDPSWPPAPAGWEYYVETQPTRDGFDLFVQPSVSPPPRLWYRKKRFLIPLGLGVLLVIGSALPDGSSPATATLVSGSASTSDSSPPQATGNRVAAAATKKAKLRKGTRASSSAAASSQDAAPKPKAKAKPKPKPKATATAKAEPKPEPSQACDPNYSEACVPIASDVDCAGGSGNGPAYLSEVAKVVGTDVYNLDSDNDGYACESN